MCAQKNRTWTNAELIERALAYRATITDEQDAAITKAAMEDPDTVLADVLTKRRPGRPVADAPKKPVSIRLSPDVLDYYRSTGPGWQGRIDETLRDAAGLKKRA
ncbi:BrnA antitoxin family protein [Phyllobacterium sp. YR531]|uniref:BrnA antitoxin family protein n=1 Tax=Phyllobacterium sp. YR531 TaxID=1144343 RepID=UPI00026F5AF7|nr:BrnA antitoxin family protein [Phyllobacterium sp. YR531]EJN05647.1 hypothetical protein PMI41_00854 [Phyllobacterium sp. YR531]